MKQPRKVAVTDIHAQLSKLLVLSKCGDRALFDAMLKETHNLVDQYANRIWTNQERKQSK